MIEVTFQDEELFNQKTQQFVIRPVGTFRFEHSLLSVSKWETIHKKPFLTDIVPKTNSELLSYVECMCMDKGFDVLKADADSINKIMEYISTPQTATTIKERPRKPGDNLRITTSEQIYASMALNGVPFSAEKWPLSRLMSLLGIIADINTDPKEKRMSREEVAEQQHRLNMERRAALGSEG